MSSLLYDKYTPEEVGSVGQPFCYWLRIYILYTVGFIFAGCILAYILQEYFHIINYFSKLHFAFGSYDHNIATGLEVKSV